MRNERNRYDAVAVDGQKVRTLRKQRGITQEAVAAGRVARGYFSTIERSPHHRVSRETAQAIAAKLGVELGDILARPAESLASATARELVSLAHPAIGNSESALAAQVRQVLLNDDGSFEQLPERLRSLIELQALDEDEKERLADYLVVQLQVGLALIVGDRKIGRGDPHD